MKKLITAFFLLLSLNLVGQEGGFRVTKESYSDMEVQMADTMRSNGKIYVVVSVVMVIFIGLVVYTASIDRKLTKMEKEVFKDQPKA